MANEKKCYVAAGRAVTTKVGIKGEGEELTTKMVDGEQKKLDLLIEKKIATNTKPDLRSKAEIVAEKNAKKAKDAKAKADADAKAKADADAKAKAGAQKK